MNIICPYCKNKLNENFLCTYIYECCVLEKIKGIYNLWIENKISKRCKRKQINEFKRKILTQKLLKILNNITKFK